MKITLEDLEKQIEIFFNNLEKVETFDVEKSLLYKYFAENEKTLFTSPYAQNVDISKYAFDGGYVCYVNNFVKACKYLYRLWNTFQPLDFTEDELLFTAYCCDLGKLSVDNLPLFVKNDIDWEIKKGFVYKLNPTVDFMKYSERSLYILQSMGMQIDNKFYLGIKLQNGLYDDNNSEYLKTFNQSKSLKTKLPLLIHQAQVIVNNS